MTRKGYAVFANKPLLSLMLSIGCANAAAAHQLAAHAGATPHDEQALRLEADVAATVALIGPPNDTDPAKLGQKSLFGAAVRWPQGKTLIVCMQHRSQPLRVLIAKTASEWLHQRPNIALDFGDMFNPRRCDVPTASADIRIADQPASDLSPFWSWVGVQALSHAREWTMDLGFDDGRDPDAAEALRLAAEGKPGRTYFHFVVLHEFGHALGALHEHQWGTCAKFLIQDRAVAEVFPSATTAAAKSAALANLAALTKSQIDSWGAVRLTAAEDPASVMRYDFPADIYRAGAPGFCANAEVRHVSPGDLEGLGKAYPQPGQATPGIATAARRALADPPPALGALARARLQALANEGATPAATAAAAAPIRLDRIPSLPLGAGAVLTRLVAPAPARPR